ncbi:hypothetical protein GCM10009678_88230 [Actinomadura kijaniata]|uniref:Kazal-like domain-containing protein n=1 Tax=Actinomadura namibiensis TaxID=182080 RepID=A0A7W3LT40_ACTNM|nr:hypothetical protein [Actinomadura namibiensis]MBA8953824.1 hypothetical protein [Actinomadura namibiensis]
MRRTDRHPAHHPARRPTRRTVRVLAPTLLALAWLGTVGPAAPAPQPAPAPPAVQLSHVGAAPVHAERCADACPTVHDPVTCTFDNGDVQVFGNRCEATRHACRAGLRIVSCARGVRAH